MEYRDIRYEKIGRVARICHNRPHVRNAEGRQLLEELNDAVIHADRDPSIGCIIIGAIGDHFSAGHDLKESAIERADQTVEQRWAFEIENYFGYAMRIRDICKPTIAQVQGACIAAGFMVANMCDLIVASEDAYFSDPTGHSLGAASVEVLVHPWVLGARRAKEFLFTGERMTASDAMLFGMVNRVVPRSNLESATLKLAERIADAPPFSLTLIKRSINRALDAQGFRTSLDAHFDTHQLSHTSTEAHQIRAERKAVTNKGGKTSFGRSVRDS